MEGLASFQQVKEVACDGFGPIAEGRRDERMWTIRTFPGVSRRRISDALERRLARPVHPAILPVEVGATIDGIYFAAPQEGQLLSLLARGCPGQILPATR